MLIKYYKRLLNSLNTIFESYSQKYTACQNDFEAKRKNQIYCSQDCKNDANNDKIKTKYHYLKALEKEQVI